MKKPQTDILLEGLAFPEAPRWKNDALWFTDQHARKVMTVSLDGKSKTVAAMDDLPGGLGWLPDGRLLVVGMTSRKLFVLANEQLNEYADLSTYALFYCNDMVVDRQGRAYVGNFGYDLHGDAPQETTHLVIVDQAGRPRTSIGDLIFPNGMIITPDGSRLIIAETFASRLTECHIKPNGDLSRTRVWAHLRDMTPDGICLDAEGSIWVASPKTNAVVRVNHNGEIMSHLHTHGTPYACILGGPERKTLFIMSSETDDPDHANIIRSGRVECKEVEIPGDGLP